MQFALRPVSAYFYSVVLLAFAVHPMKAQPRFDHDAALKHARAGFDYEQQHEYQYALFEYDTAAKLDPTYAYPVERTGGMYQELKNYPKAIEFYDRAIALDSTFDVYNYYNLGLCFHVVQKYDSAVASLKQFLNRMQPVNHADTEAMKDADWWIKFNLGCIVLQKMPKNTGDPIPLGELNSAYNEFAPSETADGSTLYFTSDRPGTNRKEVIETGGYSEDIFVTHRDSLGHFSPPEPLPPPLNSLDDEGAATVSADGQTMFMSLCRRPDGVGDCDIYRSQLVGNTWTAPQNLGRPINTPAWDAEPSITADGLTMYFSSTRPGSIDGSEDIYVAYKNTDGLWGPPQNLGEPVNTRFNDRSPFISADGKTLYFSSNGHPGFGNHDLFLSRKLSDGTWSEPVNLGRPINAYGDDVFLTIPARGDKVIYSTQRDDARSKLHLYEAMLPPQFRPGPVMLVSGTVYDKTTHDPIAAEVDVNDLKTNELVAVYHSNRVTGKFYITLGTGKSYGITATAPGYAPYSDHYTLPDTIPYRELTHDLPLTRLPFASNGPDTNGDWERNHRNHVRDSLLALKREQLERDQHVRDSLLTLKTHKQGLTAHQRDSLLALERELKLREKHERDSLLAFERQMKLHDKHVRDSLLALEKRTKGGTGTGPIIDTSGVELHNVFFDFNKSTLRPTSFNELDYWVNLLKKYPQLNIEIDGHTDSVGIAAYNARLSLARAESVKAYLVLHGISAQRLRTKGFGATEPRASNATEEGRQRNRRTEFRFISQLPRKS